MVERKFVLEDLDNPRLTRIAHLIAQSTNKLQRGEIPCDYERRSMHDDLSMDEDEQDLEDEELEY